jgi:hypothetical protein
MLYSRPHLHRLPRANHRGEERVAKVKPRNSTHARKAFETARSTNPISGTQTNIWEPRLGVRSRIRLRVTQRRAALVQCLRTAALKIGPRMSLGVGLVAWALPRRHQGWVGAAQSRQDGEGCDQ